MTPTLAIAMEQRGGDSWGVTDGSYLYKDPNSICDTFVDCELDGPSYHTRARSTGAVSEKNAHPFRQEGSKYVVIGMHNGHIMNWTDIVRKYDYKDIEVDSEVVFANIANGHPVADIQGYGAFVWWEHPVGKPEKNRRFFSRYNTEALHFAQMASGEIVYASTKEAIKTAAVLAGGEINTFYETEMRRRYFFKEVEPGKFKLFKDLMLPWGEAPVTTRFNTASSPSEVTNGRNGQYSRVTHGVEWDCPLSGCVSGKLSSKDDIICKNCYDRIARKVYGATA